MLILEDSRQRPAKHENVHSWLIANGIRYERCKLFVGDYIIANDGSTAIDTKQSVVELAMDLNGQYERFRRECKRAQDADIRLIILTEEILPEGGLAHWRPPGNLDVRFSPAALRRQLITMQERYDVRFLFCDPRETGKMIIKLLTEESRRNE